MSQEKRKTELSKSEVKELVTLYVAKVKAENAFNKAKERICKELAEGKYEVPNVGSVNKITYVQNKLNLERLKEDYPDLDLDDYKDPSEVTSVKIQNLR